MTEPTQFIIGAEASCTDGTCGEVDRVVIDLVAKAVTHLVVKPKHGNDPGRLVPLDLLDATDPEVRLRCTKAEFAMLAVAEETHFLPGGNAHGGYGEGEAYVLPPHGSGTTLGLTSERTTMGTGRGSFSHPVTEDSLPGGKVAVRKGDTVHATDGEIGHVQGLLTSPADYQVSHVLLQEGHFFGRKQVAIPISAVTDVAEGIHLNLSKEQIQELPAVHSDDSKT